ncbi:uncharacterized protein FIESC28_01897 [Fusarium coffeatum]|uniref:F-box domain-containing protein n=1 Tax=Fusarium coffeatum TaxID=231269 RepID=A0A366S8Q4_9HYPO|nr:uncharacterized protein FIESC28_01897 [Fusarium coffeatum]RBR25288.1 hypothetical protein FIESC28_01897 [Fusarium coffeatum]
MDIFNIPVEMKLEIFSYLDLTDMSAIISASPTMLRCFETNEQRILKEYKTEIGDFYQSLSNIFLAYHVGRLYRIRERHCIDTQEMVKTQVRPVLDEIRKLNFAKAWNEPGLSPVQLKMARDSEPFIREGLATRSRVFLLQDPAFKERREAYIESILLFECYTKIFYHDGGFLFTGRSDILDNLRLFNRPTCGQIPPTQSKQLYRFELQSQFRDLYKMGRRPLDDIPWISEPTVVQEQFQMHLMMQGYSFLDRLQRLDPIDRVKELRLRLWHFDKRNKWAQYEDLTREIQSALDVWINRNSNWY